MIEDPMTALLESAVASYRCRDMYRADPEPVAKKLRHVRNLLARMEWELYPAPECSEDVPWEETHGDQ